MLVLEEEALTQVDFFVAQGSRVSGVNHIELYGGVAEQQEPVSRTIKFTIYALADALQ